MLWIEEGKHDHSLRQDFVNTVLLLVMFVSR